MRNSVLFFVMTAATLVMLALFFYFKTQPDTHLSKEIDRVVAQQAPFKLQSLGHYRTVNPRVWASMQTKTKPINNFDEQFTTWSSRQMYKMEVAGPFPFTAYIREDHPSFQRVAGLRNGDVVYLSFNSKPGGFMANLDGRSYSVSNKPTIQSP